MIQCEHLIKIFFKVFNFTFKYLSFLGKAKGGGKGRDILARIQRVKVENIYVISEQFLCRPRLETNSCVPHKTVYFSVAGYVFKARYHKTAGYCHYYLAGAAWWEEYCWIYLLQALHRAVITIVIYS